MFDRRLLVLAGLCLTATPWLVIADEPEERTFPEPTMSSAIKIAGEGEGDLNEPPMLDPEVVEKLVAAARGGKSAFPDVVLKQYDADLNKSPSTSSVSLNNAVLNFCNNNLGNKVGNGQCAVLLSEALKPLKVKHFPPNGLDADYVWGTHVATIKPGKLGDAGKIQPGDLLQFRNASFKGILKTTKGTSWWSYTAGHHSAVVMRSARGGHLISVFESNVNNDLHTRKGYYDFNDLKAGTIWVYRATK